VPVLGAQELARPKDTRAIPHFPSCSRTSKVLRAESPPEKNVIAASSSEESQRERGCAPAARPLRIGVFYHADPAGNIPGGIGTVIRGIMQWAPADLEYTLYGATSDTRERPIGREFHLPTSGRVMRCVPLIAADPTGSRAAVPLTIQYVLALRKYRRTRALAHLDVLDFHRVEPLAIFRGDPRPKNVMLHQDTAAIRNKDTSIAWRHAPWLYELIEPRLLRRAQRVYCVSQAAVTRYRRVYPALRERFAFLPTWVDTSVFRPLARAERERLKARFAASLGVPPSVPLMIWIGRLDREKDPSLLLDAVKIVAERRRPFRLVIVGDGSLRPQVETRVNALGIDEHVELLGALQPTQVAALLQRADLLVLSSAYEGMPIVVLEALATGVPVVTTDVGEVRRVIRDGVNGFVAVPRTAEALATRIMRALDLGSSIGGAVCTSAVSEYVPERVLSRIYENHRRQAPLRKAR
jgi:glycosyltransferase involved in cell wall biosynthesis